jgi:hypothetical protein
MRVTDDPIPLTIFALAALVAGLAVGSGFWMAILLTH